VPLVSCISVPPPFGPDPSVPSKLCSVVSDFDGVIEVSKSILHAIARNGPAIFF